MSKADPQAARTDRPLTPAGSLDSPTAAGPWSPPSPSSAALFSCGDATASWPGVAFPRRHANPIPVGGAGAVIVSPTPPRYLPRTAATPTEAPSTTTPRYIPRAPATPTAAPATSVLRSLSVSSSKVGVGIEKIYSSAKVDGASDVLQGSSQAFGAMGVSTRIFHAVCGYIPSSSYSLPTVGRTHRAYAAGSCPRQGINNVLNYHIIKRSCIDSVLVIQDNNGSRRSPHKVLPTVNTIRTLEELNHAISLFKNGKPVHLIDVLEHDVSLNLALDFWNILLADGSTALLKRDSNLCRMSKMAYSLREQKDELKSQLITLERKVADTKHSITVISDMLVNPKMKSARRIDFSNVGGSLPSTSTTTLPSSKEKNATSLLASQEIVRTVKVTNVSLSATVQDINKFFSFSRDIEHVEMQSGDDGSQVVYVTFKDAQGAETALLLSGATIVDLSVNIAPAPEYQAPNTVLCSTNGVDPSTADKDISDNNLTLA